jgi:uncharacterized OsmC-like protein
MRISARLRSEKDVHEVALSTNGREQHLTIPPKAEGPGSGVNGGELLFLALATCYCNDVYREGKKRGVAIDRVEVEVSGEFGGEGEPARKIEYRVSAVSGAPREEVLRLLRHTDSVAEIQNTLRRSSQVMLRECEVRES